MSATKYQFGHEIARLRMRIKDDKSLPKFVATGPDENTNTNTNTNTHEEMRRVWLEGVYIKFSEIMVTWLGGNEGRAREMLGSLEASL